MTPELTDLLEKASAWARSRRPIVSIGNAEHFARVAREHEAQADRAADELEIAILIYEGSL